MTNKRQYGRAQALPSCPGNVTETLRELINALPASAKTDYLKAEVFSKFVSDDTDPPHVRRQRAINKWLATEKENEATNVRLLITPAEYNILPRVSYERFVNFCRDLVRNIIGDFPPVDSLIGSFSGGASTSRARTSSHPAGKYTGRAHATPRCLELFSDLKEEMPGWFGVVGDLEIEVVSGNVMFTVPKKTDIDRVACKEPDLNMFVQKGLGSHIEKSLLRQHINLRDQSINRRLAREGSLTGRLATLDLSSASDSVTTQLVAEMLPAEWFTVLDAVRSPVTKIDGDEHRNEMFSSMGNGFTFELESLLFYVLARATCYFEGISGVVSIYGDDIICPSDVVEPLVWVLQFFGFQVNSEKSFWTGDFRESCGGHYKDGVDITPFYVKAPLKNLCDVIDVANKVRRWAQINGLGILDPEVEHLWLYLKSLVPSGLWGGVDTTFKYQLVSSDLPRFKLQEVTADSPTGVGGYVHWLNATWDRSALFDGVSTSEKTTGTHKYLWRKAKRSSVTRLQGLFMHELT